MPQDSICLFGSTVEQFSDQSLAEAIRRMIHIKHDRASAAMPRIVLELPVLGVLLSRFKLRIQGS